MSVLKPEIPTAGKGAGNAQPADAGAFRFRMGQRADIPRCLGLLPTGFRASPAVRQRLPALWGQLYNGEARTFGVAEDLAKPSADNIEAFGFSVFVSDRFVDEFSASPQPYISALFYERILADATVLLSSEQLAIANATTGVNVLVLHFCLRNYRLSDARTAQAVTTSMAGFFFFHGGYRFRTFLYEAYGAEMLRFMQAGDFRLVRDFQSASPKQFAATAPQDYPYLFMQRRDWIELGAANPLSQLFFTPPPRILFSPAERRVLERALLNEPDHAIAEELGISEGGVKKAWHNIFERVAREAPYLVPQGDVLPDQVRGQEKRRHLLDYLRTHLEELRPYKRPSP
jgi:DNA-binding CsgD family transcriptional regulator